MRTATGDRVEESFARWRQEVEREAAADERLDEAIRSLDGWRFAERAADERLFRRVMEWSGLMTEAELPQQAMIPEYLVAVFQHEVIAVYHRTVAGGGGPLGFPRQLPLPAGGAGESRLLRRLARTAVRAVYALGLDLGLARIALAPRGRLAVRGVDPFPASPAGLAGAYAAALSAYAAAAASAAQRVSTSETDDIVLGLDVEFVLTTPRGELVPAGRFLPAGGPAGYDAAVVDRRVIHAALAELRPAPSGEPRQLFANLRRAMRLAAERITDPALEWRAGGSPVEGISLGGHIHMSGVPLTFELLRALDNYLALPLALLEDARAVLRRPTFGWLGNARLKPHGGFEYRTPASWLVSPAVARGAIATAKLVAVHCAELRRRPLNKLRMQRAYYAGDKQTLGSFLEDWKRDMMGLSTFSQYEGDIVPFMKLIESGYSWSESADIRDAWRIGRRMTIRRSTGSRIML